MKRLKLWFAIGMLALFLAHLTLTKITNAQTTTDCSKVAETGIPQAECQALVTLYTSTNGPNWTTKTGWNTTNTPCNWNGVTCSAGNVTQLDLSNNQLSGNIPLELGNLPNLQRLELNSNQLSGSIPITLGNLSSLQSLKLYSNQLSGSIPTTLSKLPNLLYLELYNNKLSGSIPVELSNLAKLQWLNLYSNQLSGSIPITLGNLLNLQLLLLNNNQLSGSIPISLGNLPNLQRLELNNNQLSGNIPTSLGKLTALKQLYLGNNQLSGSIPSELGKLTALQNLYLNDNQLSGSIPSELGNLTNLQGSSLANNQLISGSIPTSFGNLTNLQSLYLSYNQLSGSVPSELGNLTNLQSLYLSYNQLSGILPSTLPNHLTKLTQFYFSNNSGLCEPADTAFQTWLSGIPNLGRTGICPTATPTATVTVTVTNTPTVTNTNSPTPTNTATVTTTATNFSTVAPTNTPTVTSTPTVAPTNTPTVTPTNTPTVTPTGTPTVTPTGTPFVADIGFRPSKNGYKFENYGNVLPELDFNNNQNYSTTVVWTLFRRTFATATDKDLFFETIDGGQVLSDLGKNLFNEFRSIAKIGSCEGIAATSLGRFIRHKQVINTEDLLGNNISPTLELSKDDQSTQNFIHVQHARQLAGGSEDWSKENNTTQKAAPLAHYNAIKNALSGCSSKRECADLPLVWIVNPDKAGSHAMVPYRIEETEKTAKIYVYDSNHPNDDNRYIAITKVFNEAKTLIGVSWSYELGYNNGNLITWAGSYTKTNSLLAPPLSALTSSTLPSSVAPDGGGRCCRHSFKISGQGNGADLLITDSNGQSLGYKDGKKVSEIPGGLFIPLFGFNLANPTAELLEKYILSAPDPKGYQIKAQGVTTEPYTISMTSQATTLLNLTNLSSGLSQTNVISMSAGLAKVELQPAVAQKHSCFVRATNIETQSGQIIELCANAPAGGVASFEVITPTGEIHYRNNGGDTNYDLTVKQVATNPFVYTKTGVLSKGVLLKVNQSESTVNITATEGGTLTVDDLKLVFPKGAVANDVTLKYKAADKPQHLLTSGKKALQSFSLEATDKEGTQVRKFQKDYTIVLNYTNNDLAAAGISDATTLTLAFWDEAKAEWVPVTSKVEQATQQVVCTLDHFTEFALIGNDATASTKQQVFLPLIQK